MTIKLKLDSTTYEIKEPCFEIEALIENNTLDVVDGVMQHKNGVGHSKIVRVQLYLLKINDDTNISESSVKNLKVEHASSILNVIDGMPSYLVESKYKNEKRVINKQIEIEKKEVEKLELKLNELDNETKQTETEIKQES